jgi:hypothetical protein
MRDPIVCPSCETVLDPTAHLKTRRTRPSAKVVAEREEAKKDIEVDDDLGLDDDDIVIDDDDELDEDDDDLDDVPGKSIGDEDDEDEDEDEEDENQNAIEDVSELGDDDVTDVIDADVEDDETRP